MRASFFLLSLFASSAFAGTWGSSGGGEFMRDQHNPWFVKNTTEVRYCLELDREGFSAQPEKIKALTAQAIQFWKGEFTSRSNVLGVGTQEFKLTNDFPNEKCKGDEDLKIQFGYGSLTPEQLKEFSDHEENPQSYVGISIRTAYDKVRLKGKGFVFISSDRGAHPYNSGNGIGSNLWSHDGLLFRALQHELGHVFGVPHTDTGFMAADFPENMVRNYRPFLTVGMQPFFAPSNATETCVTDIGFLQGLACLQVRSEDQWRSFRLVGITIARQELPIGKASSVTRVSTKQTFPVRLFLPDEQTVFPRLPGELVLKGPSRVELKLMASFEETSGEKSQLLLDLSPDSTEIYQNKDGFLQRRL